MAISHIIIVGGGFAGLAAAKQLKEAKANITLISKTNHHLFQPLLYQVATAALSPNEIAIPLREACKKQKNITFLTSTVSAVKNKEKLVVLSDGQELSFDYLVLAPGARHAYFGNNHWETWAPGLKTLSDAEYLRRRILETLENAEYTWRLDSQKEKTPLNFVLIGGGPTGVELAGALAEWLHNAQKDFQYVDLSSAKVFLIEALTTILPSFPPHLGEYTQQKLQQLGVQVLTNKKVTDINENGVQVDNMFIPSENVIWAAGNQAPSFLSTLGVPLDRAGRVIVNNDLSIPGNPTIFVAGDAAHYAHGKNEQPLPAVATAALQQGRYVGRLIAQELQGKTRPLFSYFDKGSMAVIHWGQAVLSFRNFSLKGFFSWIAWCIVHVFYIEGRWNRKKVCRNWKIYHFFQRKSNCVFDPKDSLPKT